MAFLEIMRDKGLQATQDDYTDVFRKSECSGTLMGKPGTIGQTPLLHRRASDTGKRGRVEKKRSDNYENYETLHSNHP